MTSPAIRLSSEAKELIKTLRSLLLAGHLSPKFQIKGESLHVLVIYPVGFKPDERTLADHIRKSLEPLPRGEFQFISLYGCTQGQNHPDWMQKINLLESPIVRLPASVSASPPVIPTSNCPNKAQPSKSITTVKPKTPLPSFKSHSARTKAVANHHPQNWKPLRQALLAVAVMTALASVGVYGYLRWLSPEAQITFEVPDGRGGFETIRSVMPEADAEMIDEVIQDLERAMQRGEFDRAVGRIDELIQWFPQSNSLGAYRSRIARLAGDSTASLASPTLPPPADTPEPVPPAPPAPPAPIPVAQRETELSQLSPPAPVPPAPALAPPSPTLSPAQLQSLLTQQVNQEDWTAALATTERLVQIAPNRQTELREYQQRLRALAEESYRPESYLSRSAPEPVPPAVVARADVNWGPWLADLKRRVEGNWIPGQSGASHRTVVMFNVGRNGSLSNPRISRSSGHQPTDDAALQAISRAAPYMPLPAEYVGDAVQINFTFDINVLGQLEGSGAGI